MIILGISCFYHDAAAAIIRDGKVIAAAAEERFTRKKHDNNFPAHAIHFCLNWLHMNASDIDLVTFYEKPIIKFERILFQHFQHFPKSRKVFSDTIPQWLSNKLHIPKLLRKEIGYTGPIIYVPHHLSHAASAYYLSDFNKAAIVTLDGVGEWATTTMGVGNGANILIEREIRFPHSLGLLYSALTAFLGFKVNDAEYKVMGLAAYGNPNPYKAQFDELVIGYPDGSFALNMNYFDYTWTDHMPSKRMSSLFGIPPREPESTMTAPYENIAAALQKKLEDTVFHLLNQVYKTYKTPNLCLSGGVALNSVMNGKIMTHTPFKQLFIPPDPGDAGGAIGAALYAWNRKCGQKKKIEFFPSLGPSFSVEQIKDTLDTYQLHYTYYQDTHKLLSSVATYLTKQKVIGWFQGRMEWGPRALGNRSIIASATKEKMKDIINSKVKHREMFRPFAPVILEKYVHDYFITDKNMTPSAHYMLMVYPFTQKGKKNAAATVHVDGTGRLQVLRRSDNLLYYDVIDEYRKKTEIPVIINTSFNVRGQPIVCSPKDAVECFLKTEIDYLVIDRFLVKKIHYG